MHKMLATFEAIARSSTTLAYAEPPLKEVLHPFEIRNLSSMLPLDVRRLFDNGPYSQATFEAYKYVDQQVARIAGIEQSGYKLMMAAFSPTSPIIHLTPCATKSEIDEQNGYQFIFAGSAMAIRNPRAHQYAVKDSPDDCLDHLSLASMLVRRLEVAGFILDI